MTTTIEWKVTWFPPHKKEASKTGTEAEVREAARLWAEYNPIIDKRTVTVSEWETVENLSLGVVNGRWPDPLGTYHERHAAGPLPVEGFACGSCQVAQGGRS